MSVPDTSYRNQFSYAAYWDGWCKGIASADADFVEHASKYVAQWKEAGGEVKLIDSEQAKADMGKWLDHRKQPESQQGQLL